MQPPLLDALRVHLLARRKAARTITTYLDLAQSFLRLLGETPPIPSDVESFLARPRLAGGRRAASSINQALSAVRALARVAVADGTWPRDPTADIAMLREPTKEPTFLSRDELSAVFRAAARNDNLSARARDLALLAVLATTGLRVHEVVALDIQQLERASGTLLDVRGKGETRHHVAVAASTVALLDDWLRHRERVARVDERALFVSNAGTRWSIRTVQRHVSALGERAGLAKRIAPHALRHTLGTQALAMGVDILTLADIMRHSDLATTRRYVHLGTERKRRAADTLDRLVPSEVLPRTETSQAGDVFHLSTVDTKGDLDDNVSKAA